MIYSFILPAYIAAFAILFEKMGFRWKWFLPLALAFIVATLLASLVSGISPQASDGSTGMEDRFQLLATPLYILFCPIHAFITVRVMKAIPKDSPRFDQLFVKVLIYAAAAWAASFVFVILTGLCFSAYYLIKYIIDWVLTNLSFLW